MMRSPIWITRQVSNGPDGYSVIWARGPKLELTAYIGTKRVTLTDYRKTTLQIWAADWLARLLGKA